MVKNYVPSKIVTDSFYELVFDDGHNNGFGFPCNKDGEITEKLESAAIENLEFCLQNPDKFKRWNEVVKFSYTYRKPASGICKCGEYIELTDDYYGACECEKCGRWYNLFGQELLHPDYWENDPSNEEYY